MLTYHFCGVSPNGIAIPNPYGHVPDAGIEPAEQPNYLRADPAASVLLCFAAYPTDKSSIALVSYPKPDKGVTSTEWRFGRHPRHTKEPCHTKEDGGFYVGYGMQSQITTNCTTPSPRYFRRILVTDDNLAS